ncbi:Os07g0200900, partial [Oryza sativa Japonica Group]
RRRRRAVASPAVQGGWLMRDYGSDMDNAAAAGAFLAWKEQPVVWTSAWMP